MPGTCEERKDMRLEEEGMEGSGVRGNGQQKPDHAHAEPPMPALALAPCLYWPLPSGPCGFRHLPKLLHGRLSAPREAQVLQHLTARGKTRSALSSIQLPNNIFISFLYACGPRRHCLGQSLVPGGLRGLFCIGVCGNVYRSFIQKSK